MGSSIKPWNIILEEFKSIHHDKYTYFSDTYKGSSQKMKLKCNVCGYEFMQTPNKHLLGQGCPKCGRCMKHTLEDFIHAVESKYPNQYTFENTVYVNSRTKLTVTCKKHGDIIVNPKSFIDGCGCRYCKEEKQNRFKELFEEKARRVHPVEEELDYSQSIYVNNHTKLKIYCHKKDEFGNEHGIFYQTPAHHLNGQGCPKCNGNAKMTSEDFIIKANSIHNYAFEYFPEKYNGYNNNTEIKCKKCGNIFKQTPHNHLKGEGCPYCVGSISKPENDIKEFISQFVEVETGNRKLLNNSREIDILVPSKNIAFEYDGLIWHSEKFGKDRNYHLNKTEECKKFGIDLYHIFEDEWVNKREIVKSKIRSIIGAVDNKIHARKCEIREVTPNDTSIFLENNHLQGECKSKYRYGLYYNNELVSIMTFGHLRKNLGSRGGDDEYELLRFCNKLNTSVVGGASKLLKHFMKTVNPSRVISYADKRWSNGNLYKVLGFTHLRDSSPGYFYVVGQKRENRFKYRKDVLIRDGFNPNKSEHEIMIERGIYRIYDCGSMVFEIKNREQ